MKKILSALLVCAALVSTSVSADPWRHGGYYHGGYHGGGLITGVIVGTVVGAAISQPRYYAPAPVVYTQRVPVYCVDAYGSRYVCGWQYVQPAYYP